MWSCKHSRMIDFTSARGKESSMKKYDAYTSQSTQEIRRNLKILLRMNSERRIDWW